MRASRSALLDPYDVVHKMWQTHNHTYLLQGDNEKRDYLNQLFRYYPEAYAGGVRFHAFCLMDTHVHEILQIGEHSAPFSNMMRDSHSTFGARLNKRNGRTGKIGRERPKTKVIRNAPSSDPSVDPIHPVIRCMCYLDANPVLAGLVTRAEDWPWSSYRRYALGEVDMWTRRLEPPEAYLALGDTPQERQVEYRKIYVMCLEEKLGELAEVHQADHSEPGEGTGEARSSGPTMADYRRGYMGKGRFIGDPQWASLRETALLDTLRDARQRQQKARKVHLAQVSAALTARPPPWAQEHAA
jgi:putative transposase